MENLFWAISCLIIICIAYFIISVCYYIVILGAKIEDAIYETLREFKFWEQ
jgi:hypothetical protein